MDRSRQVAGAGRPSPGRLVQSWIAVVGFRCCWDSGFSDLHQRRCAFWASKTLPTTATKRCQVAVCEAHFRHRFSFFYCPSSSRCRLFGRQSYSCSSDRPTCRSRIQRCLSNVQPWASLIQHVSNATVASVWRSDCSGRFALDSHNISALYCYWTGGQRAIFAAAGVPRQSSAPPVGR